MIVLIISVNNVQKIDITDRNGFQDIDIENTIEQKVDIKQDVIIVPVYKDAQPYEGEYEVTPKIIKQTLPTTKKLLYEDVTIKEIPFFKVSNNSGGNTVFIGSEV